MTSFVPFADSALLPASLESLDFQLPDPQDDSIPEIDFQQKVEVAWQICDRFDLQTDIWRGRILRTVRDREKQTGDGRGTGFLNWLKDREISKSQAYQWIELANSADMLLHNGVLEPETINRFSKRAFIETAHAAPEVQQMVTEAARSGEQITRREVRQLSEEWTAMTSDLLPPEVKEKAAASIIPTRYLAPLVKEMEKLPEPHQEAIREAIAENPDVDALKQATAEARHLARYLASSAQVQRLAAEQIDLTSALEEAVRVGCLNSAADLVSQAATLEQMVMKLYGAWKRLNSLAERVYLDSGASTPHLRRLLSHLEALTNAHLEVQLGQMATAKTIRVVIQEESIATDDRQYAELE